MNFSGLGTGDNMLTIDVDLGYRRCLYIDRSDGSEGKAGTSSEQLVECERRLSCQTVNGYFAALGANREQIRLPQI